MQQPPSTPPLQKIATAHIELIPEDEKMVTQKRPDDSEADIAEERVPKKMKTS